MKKSLAVSGALMLLAGTALAACGETATLKADIFIYQYSDTYIGTVRTALKTDLDTAKVASTFYDGAGNQATQTGQIEDAISAGSKLLIANLVEQTASGLSVATKAKTAGIPVIFFNREVSDDAVKAYDQACFVGTDPDQAGYMQGDLIANALIATGNKLSTVWDKNGDGYINYVMLRADESNAEANGRTKYSVQEANTKLKAAGLHELRQLGADVNAGWSKDTAKTDMDDFITTFGVGSSSVTDAGKGIELVIANNDDMALGAVQSLQASNYNKTTTTDLSSTLLVVGVDATASAQTAINAKQMYGSVKQDASAMAACISALAVNKLNGKDYLANTSYAWESTTVRKIRIPYSTYTGTAA